MHFNKSHTLLTIPHPGISRIAARSSNLGKDDVVRFNTICFAYLTELCWDEGGWGDGWGCGGGSIGCWTGDGIMAIVLLTCRLSDIRKLDNEYPQYQIASASPLHHPHPRLLKTQKIGGCLQKVSECSDRLSLHHHYLSVARVKLHCFPNSIIICSDSKSWFPSSTSSFWFIFE